MGERLEVLGPGGDELFVVKLVADDHVGQAVESATLLPGRTGSQ